MRTPSASDLLAIAIRGAGALCALVLAAGAFTVYEAASSTERALKQARLALASHGGDMLKEAIDEAADTLDSSWAQPLDWHAGAQEARSWLYARQAQTRSDPSLLSASAAMAADSVARDPVQPAAWARLASLAMTPGTHARCTVRECLNYSWRAAQMAEDDVACPRLQIAYESRLLHPDDIRITWVAQSDYWGSVVRRCFSFMRPGDMFRALMIAEQAEAEREARRAAR